MTSHLVKDIILLFKEFSHKDKLLELYYSGLNKIGLCQKLPQQSMFIISQTSIETLQKI